MRNLFLLLALVGSFEARGQKNLWEDAKDEGDISLYCDTDNLIQGVMPDGTIWGFDLKTGNPLGKKGVEGGPQFSTDGPYASPDGGINTITMKMDPEGTLTTGAWVDGVPKGKYRFELYPAPEKKPFSVASCVLDLFGKKVPPVKKGSRYSTSRAYIDLEIPLKEGRATLEIEFDPTKTEEEMAVSITGGKVARYWIVQHIARSDVFKECPGPGMQTEKSRKMWREHCVNRAEAKYYKEWDEKLWKLWPLYLKARQKRRDAGEKDPIFFDPMKEFWQLDLKKLAGE